MRTLVLVLIFHFVAEEILAETIKCNHPVTPSGKYVRILPPEKKRRAGEKSVVPNEEELDDDDKLFVVINMGEEPAWVKWKQLREMLERGETYLDVTYGGYAEPTLSRQGVSTTYPVPVDIRYQDVVAKMIESINVEEMQSFLTYWSTTFPCRTSASEGDSIKASAWLHTQMLNILKNYEGPCADASQYQHTTWFATMLRAVKSVIVRLLGADPELRKEVLVLGAHIDAYPFLRPCPLPAADDDGSGVTAILETLKILVNNKFRPRRTIEFHFYAYEEQGLKGSREIAEDYRNNSVNVVGMLNLDMAGHAPKDKPDALTVAISERDTNPQINQFLRQLISQYLTIPAKVNEVCKRCNSDHFPWTYQGYPSSFPHEMHLSHHLHTSSDTVDTVDFEYLKEFTKLAIAFAVEYGEPMS